MHVEWMELEYDILTIEGGAKFVENVTFNRVRPDADVIESNFEYEDLVDVWMMNEWWSGVCLGMQGDMYTVYFDYFDEGWQYFPAAKECVGRSRKWKYEDGKSRWVYYQM